MATASQIDGKSPDIAVVLSVRLFFRALLVPVPPNARHPPYLIRSDDPQWLTPAAE